MIKAAETLKCPICDMFARSKPARPANPQRDRELGGCVGIDFSYHAMANGKRFLVANFVDEASRFHVGVVLKEAFCDADEHLRNPDADLVWDTFQQN